MKRVQHEKPPRNPETTKWIEDEAQAQNIRYGKIVSEMEALQPQRDGWIEQFLKDVQNRGFHITGDMTRKISKQEVPTRPNSKDADRVVW